MIMSDKQISPPSLAWNNCTFTKSYKDEFPKQKSWKEFPRQNSTDAQSFIFVEINFLSQIMLLYFLCFNFISTHYHTQKQKKNKNYLR